MSACEIVQDPSHLFTVDVEEYFHALNLRPAFPERDWLELPWRAERGVDQCLDMLERAGCKATFFVLGWIAEHQPELVKRIAGEGHEIASHGYSHKMAGELGPEGFEHDVRASLELALHVLEIMEALGTAAEGGTRIEIDSTCERPAAVPAGFDEAVFI